MRRALLPDDQVVKFRYSTQGTLNPGLGAVDTHLFSANGMYDPDVAVGGSQPRGFDQIMALYDHYVVLNARATVWFTPVATATNNYVVGVSLEDDTTAAVTLVDYAEGFRVSSGVLQSNGDAKCFKMDFSATEFFGRSKSAVLGDDQLYGTTSANPSEQAIFHLFAGPANPTEDPGSLNFYIVIDYVAQLKEHKLPTQS